MSSLQRDDEQQQQAFSFSIDYRLSDDFAMWWNEMLMANGCTSTTLSDNIDIGMAKRNLYSRSTAEVRYSTAKEFFAGWKPKFRAHKPAPKHAEMQLSRAHRR